MTKSAVLQKIRQIPLLADMPDHLIVTFVPRLSWLDVAAGTTIVDHDDTTDDVLFVITGKVRIHIQTEGGREVILDDILPGQLFGEMSAIDGSRRSASATALVRTKLGRIHSSHFRRLLDDWPMLANRLLRLMIERVRTANARMVELSALDVRHRLYAELLRIAVVTDSNGSRRISPPPTQQILANRIGARREAVSREMANLERHGEIKRSRSVLIVTRPAHLESLIKKAMRK